MVQTRAMKNAKNRLYQMTPESIERRQNMGHREYIRSLKDVPCTDCGVQYPSYIMQFDHVPSRGEKSFNVPTGLHRPIEELDAEIAKCDVVCGNCHAERTHGTRKEKA